MTCCLRGCDSEITHEHHIRGGSGAFSENLTYIARVCEACRKEMEGKPMKCNYFRAGKFAFVNEMWEAADGKKGNIV